MSSLEDGVVRLRTWSVTDAAWYAETAAHDEQIQRFTAESPDVTEADVAAAIEALLAGLPNAVGYLIADAITGERLGNIALGVEDSIGHMSYWLAATARGRGVATRAVQLLSTWAFEHLGLTELRLWAHVDNSPSRAVAERVGFVRDPERDETRIVKDARWPVVAYRLAR